MRAVVYRAPGEVVIEQIATPTLGARDVRLTVEACGVCGSDLASFADGHYIDPGQVMGHEIAGRVRDLGSALTGLAVGDRVAVRPMRSCGRCPYCLADAAHLCDHTRGPSLGYGTPGGFADTLVLTEAVVGEDLIVVGEGVDPFDLLWAEPLAVALHAIARIGGVPTSLLVIGAGAVGLTVIAAAVAQGIAVTAVEPIAERRDAAARLGAIVHAPSALPSAVRFDAAVDGSGMPAAVLAIAPHLAPGAPVVLVGLNDAPVARLGAGHPVIGAFAYSQHDFVRAVELISSGAVTLGSFVTHRFDLDDAAQALRRPAPGEHVVKVAIVPQEGTS